MTKVLIVFAQFAEARATIELTKAIPSKEEQIHIWSEGIQPSSYEFAQGIIALSNVGLHSAQMCVTKYAHHCHEVWNFGLAGCLKEGLPIGELLSIQLIGKYIPLEKHEVDERTQECLDSSLPQFSLETEGGRLISSDFPIHDPLHRTRLLSSWDLVDMEGYGVAFASTSLGKKCKMWKIVSDFASPGGRELIRTHKKELSEKMALKVLDLLKHKV